MSIFSAVKLTSASSVLAAKRNADQQKLIANTPTMIDALAVLVDRQITKGSTHTMLVSFVEGYNKYGRLRPAMLATLQDVILQNSDALLKIISEAQSQETPQPVKNTQPEREPGDESENDHDEDPFA